ncbi:hypothetical protein VFPFJ_11117 [Purpureocillium lilacinum]|uniref:Uncharacterized protein n=1 Tax=Purpureocillium lilacinum TaxID=33203 RepID=A0A179FQI4_PURLI|nr:hypothetical protein VFPFJ_11117 [Purpureocillium lilacinum]OAQ67528.1 hypothetical protein VFPFJ_11117 [Purpureocillium lilacinum]OAQ69429.1 hypothetical protein VFPBJ_10804 [Purpureocillium lilacinum]
MILSGDSAALHRARNGFSAFAELRSCPDRQLTITVNRRAAQKLTVPGNDQGPLGSVDLQVEGARRFTRWPELPLPEPYGSIEPSPHPGRRRPGAAKRFELPNLQQDSGSLVHARGRLVQMPCRLGSAI